MKRNILFVEDDKVDQAAIQRSVVRDKFPHDYQIVGSLKEAKSAMAKTKFDLAIVDFHLPDGTCFDFFHFLDGIPFVIVTGAGSEEIAVEAMKCGASDYLVKDPDRKYLALLQSVVDSTIKANETDQTVRMLLSAMSSISDSVYITDKYGVIIYANEAFSKVYGYKTEEIIGQPASCLLGNGKPSGSDDIFHKKKNGTTFPALISESPVNDAQGNKVRTVVVVHDMTERKKLETALEEAIEKYSLLLDQIENKNFELEKGKKELEMNIEKFRAAYDGLIAAPK